MSNYIEHAKREFAALGYNENEKDGPERWMRIDVMELLKIFAAQKHSGFSAAYCVKIFSKLAMFEPLAPLTGEDNEWEEVSNGCWQNKRCSHVFKDNRMFNGQAYDIEGRVFREPDGRCYTNADSFVPITFPYTLKREYVNVPKGPKVEE